jgi:hypothetical protein
VSKVKTKSVDAKRVAGIIVGVIASGFLFLPVFWYLDMVITPPPASWYEYMPGMAGPLILGFLLGSNVLGIIFAVLTKALLGRSIVFGATFILLGILNSYILTQMRFRVWYSWGEGTPLLYIPSIVSSLVGVFLVVSSRRLRVHQDME